MHAAACFVPPARHVPKKHASSGVERHHAAFTTVAASIDAQESMRQRATKFLLVAVLHAGLFGWLANVDTSTREHQTPVRLAGRAIEVSLASAARPAPISNAVASVMDRQLSERQKKPALPKQAKTRPVPERVASPFTVPAPASQAATTGTPVENMASTVSAAAPTAASSAAVGAGTSTSSAAIFDADYLRNPAPDYPSASRRSREQGKVHLDVTVTPEGKAADIRIRHSSGHARLDEAALGTVRNWRFVAARRGNEAVTAQVIVPIEFRLAD
jgi:TonB family protein